MDCRRKPEAYHHKVSYGTARAVGFGEAIQSEGKRRAIWQRAFVFVVGSRRRTEWRCRVRQKEEKAGDDGGCLGTAAVAVTRNPGEGPQERGQ